MTAPLADSLDGLGVNGGRLIASSRKPHLTNKSESRADETQSVFDIQFLCPLWVADYGAEEGVTIAHALCKLEFRVRETHTFNKPHSPTSVS